MRSNTTPDSPVSPSVSAGAWLWYAWLERPKADAAPVYGFMTSTHAHPKPSLQRYPLASGRTLCVGSRILTSDEQEALAQAFVNVPHEVNLQALWPAAPIIPVAHRRDVSMSVFNIDPVRVDTRYSLIAPEVLWGPAEDGQEIISRCEALSGLPLRSAFVTHLGGFDIFHMPAWLEGREPFELEFLRSDGSYFARLWIRPPRSHELVMHLKARFDHEVVFNRLSEVIASGAMRFELLMPTDIDGFEYELFDATKGELIYSHSGAFIREASVPLAVAGRTIHHADRLARTGQGSRSHRRATQTTALQQLPIHAGWDPNGLRAHWKKANRYIEACFEAPSADRWFPNTVEDALGALDYLNELLNTLDFSEAILIDPFFGEDALERFATRLTRQGAKITIVASWARTDPDTAQRIRGEPEDVNHQLMDRLESLFQGIGRHLAPRLEFMNLLAGTNVAFHDRYLLIDRQDGPEQVFLLSNSLNNIAADWPFCMSELSGSARRLAAEYIHDLVAAKERPGQSPLTINFRWPAHAPARS